MTFFYFDYIGCMIVKLGLNCQIHIYLGVW